MKSSPEMEQLVGKMVLDTEFRHMMLEAPKETAESVGVYLTAMQASQIQEWDAEALRNLAVLLRKFIGPMAVTW